MGFNIYRTTALSDLRTRLNESLIPCQYAGSPMGTTYTWLDLSVVPGLSHRYWLEDIDVYGTAVQHGPVYVTLPSVPPRYTTFLPIKCR